MPNELREKGADLSAQPSVQVRPLGRPSMLKRNRAFFLGVLGVIVFIALWQAAFTLELVNPVLVGDPLGTLRSLVDLLFIDGELWPHIRASGIEFALGFSIGVVAGIVLGLLIGRFRWLDEMSDPLVGAFYATPYVAFLPVIMLTFGISLTSKVVIVIWAVFFPMLINTIAGVKNVPRDFLTLATSFSISKIRVFTTILGPASIPYILAGLRQAIGRGLVGVLVAELFFANEGIGYFISVASGSYRMNDAFAAIAVTAITGVALVRLVGRIEERLAVSWGLSTKR